MIQESLEDFINEGKASFWTSKENKGIMEPFRLGTDDFDIVKAYHLSDIKTGRAYGDELGFDSAADRKAAETILQKMYQSGKLKEAVNEAKMKKGDFVVIGAPHFVEEIQDKIGKLLMYDDVYKVEKVKGKNLVVVGAEGSVEVPAKYFVMDESVNEGKKVDAKAWDKMSEDEREAALLTAMDDPDNIDKYIDMKFRNLPSEIASNMYAESNQINEEEDFVVGGFSGGYSSSSSRYDYIVTAKNKTEAKKKLKNKKPSLRKLYAAPVSSYSALDPYAVFQRLGESNEVNERKHGFKVQDIDHDEWDWEFQIKTELGDKEYKAMNKAGIEFGTAHGETWVQGRGDNGLRQTIAALQKMGINESIMEEINEGRASIKRKYGIHSSVRVNEKAPLRNTIIKYIGNKVMTEEQIKNMLIRVEEDLGKAVNQKRWFSTNTRYFKRSKNESGDITWQLSKFGKRIYDNMSKTKTTKNDKLVSESLQEFTTFKNLDSVFEGRSEVQTAIKHIQMGAGWAGDEYLYQFGGPMGLDKKDLSALAVELAKQGLLFREADLTDEMIEGDEDPRYSDIEPMSVADAKKMKF